MCSVAGCQKVGVKRTYCQTHYTRWHRHGSPNISKVPRHGMHKAPEHAIWSAMKDRCGNPKSEYYYLYGGRGIKVCEAWQISFETFFKDMGAKPTSLHSLDRIDNNKGYSPENCRWATSKEQAINRRTTRLVYDNGKAYSLKGYCEKKKLSYTAIQTRVKKLNWSLELAINTPIKKKARIAISVSQ